MFTCLHPYRYYAPISVSIIDVRTAFHELVLIKYSRSTILIPAESDNPFDAKSSCRSCQSLSDIRKFRMGMGSGGSGSDFLGSPMVTSNSGHWVFSQDLLRAIAFGLYGVNQCVYPSNGFCRRIIGVEGLMMELACC